MTAAETIIKKPTARKKMSVEEEIAYFAKKLAAARAKQREQEGARRRQNEKNVIGLLKSENMLVIQHETWKAALPDIQKILDRKQLTVTNQTVQGVENTSNDGNSI